MTYHGKRVCTGTGMGVDPMMYTVAILEDHHGERIWFVHRQSTSPESIVRGYLELRKIWGNDAQIAIMTPGSIH